MKILTISDCHGKLTEEEITGFIQGKEIDCVFLLGDNLNEDIEKVKRCELIADVPKYGITGNHDYMAILKDNGIENIHCKTVDVCGYKVGGFSGTVKYKPIETALMFTQEECCRLLKAFSACDILITHDKPCFNFISPRTNAYGFCNAHSGLKGIGDYIKRNKPLLVLHGHLHESKQTVYKETIIRCCYRLEYIEIERKRI